MIRSDRARAGLIGIQKWTDSVVADCGRVGIPIQVDSASSLAEDD
jgi:hypothetical protein